MGIINGILTYCRYILGKAPQAQAPTVVAYNAPEEKKLVGTNGALTCDVLVLKEDQRVVLAIDHDFMDLPEWVEWDIPRDIIGVAQMGGAVAEIGSVIPAEKREMFRDVRGVFLATRFDGSPVAHMVYLVIRE